MEAVDLFEQKWFLQPHHIYMYMYPLSNYQRVQGRMIISPKKKYNVKSLHILPECDCEWNVYSLPIFILKVISDLRDLWFPSENHMHYVQYF